MGVYRKVYVNVKLGGMKAIIVRGERYDWNPVFKTYNSRSQNELLKWSDLGIVEVKAGMAGYPVVTRDNPQHAGIKGREKRRTMSEQLKIATHSWFVNHWQEQARGCSNRKVDSIKLHRMPWLRGCCQVCHNFKGKKHIHRGTGISYNAIHASCLNNKKGDKGREGENGKNTRA